MAVDPAGQARVLYSDPFEDPSSAWRLGRPVDLEQALLLTPVRPGKIVGVGRNFTAHAHELANPVPIEPVLFLKAPSAVIGPNSPIVLPPESERVEHEGEAALVIGRRLRNATADDARAGLLGVTCGCDVTARDLQRKDPTFARAKSFDTFCPLGPFVWTNPVLDDLTIETRVNGATRQLGNTAEMLFSPIDLLVYISRMMTLEPGDVVLTGSPAGVGPLEDGDRVEVEIRSVGVLSNPVERWKQD